MPQKAESSRQNKDISILVITPIGNLSVREVNDTMKSLGFKEDQFQIESKDAALRWVALRKKQNNHYNAIICHGNHPSLRKHPETYVDLQDLPYTINTFESELRQSFEHYIHSS